MKMQPAQPTLPSGDIFWHCVRLFLTDIFLFWLLLDSDKWPFPLMVREALEGDAYHGFITVHGRAYRMRVCSSRKDAASNEGRVALEMQPELYQLLGTEERMLRQRLNQCEDVASFLWEIKEIIDRVSMDSSMIEAPGAEAMEGIVREIEDIGWDHVVNLDESFKNIELAINDASNREHVLALHVPASYPAHAPACRSQLPLPFAPTWRYGGCLSDITAQFSTALGQFQDLWDILDDLDAHTHVLEPEKPSRDICMRRYLIFFQALDMRIGGDSAERF
jgi:hypothetical protein